jgi:hypothetical protein
MKKEGTVLSAHGEMAALALSGSSLIVARDALPARRADHPGLP